MEKKVLHVIGTLRVGGAESMVMNILRYIDRRKFQFDFLIFEEDFQGNYEIEANSLGSNIIRINKPSESYKEFYYDLKKILKSGNYDIVHSHTLLNNGIVLKAAYVEGIRVRISHSHSTLSGKSENIIYKLYSLLMKNWINKFATHIIACGKDAGYYLYGKKQFKDNGYIMKNGIDINRYLFNTNNEKKIRNEFQLENKFIIGHVGRFATVKNHEFLIDVFNEVQKQNQNAVLMLVGEGELFKQIKEKVEKLRLEEKVIFTGLRDDVNLLLQAFDLFVFPSLYEGLPVSVVEAQAAGLNCLISNSITDEICITENVKKIPLNNQLWVDEILKYTAVNVEKYYVREDLEKTGYDIKSVINNLEEIYGD